ncbi:hypothetical protein FKM82_012630 [Ascaphus truei]
MSARKERWDLEPSDGGGGGFSTRLLCYLLCSCFCLLVLMSAHRVQRFTSMKKPHLSIWNESGHDQCIWRMRTSWLTRGIDKIRVYYRGA